MKTTLIVERNEYLQNFLTINLYTWVGTEVLPFESAQMVINYLKEDSSQYDLIITRDNIGTEKTSNAILDHLKSNNIKTPIISIGKSPPESESCVHIKSCLDIKEIVRTCAKELKVTAKEMAAKSVPDFFPIPINFFQYMKNCFVDVFVQTDSEVKFEEIFKSYTEINEEKLKGLVASGTTHLFVKKEDRLKFVTQLTEELATEISFKELSESEQMKASEMGRSLVHKKLTLLGVTAETVEAANKNLKTMVNTAQRVPGLLRLLRRLMSNKSSYLFKHSQILMFIGSHVLEHIDWGNEEQIEKFQFIAFFHDICLENDEQAKISSDAELRKSALTPAKKELVKKHAQMASSLVSQYPRSPMGSEQIIRQHHGIPHGIGFGESYSSNLSPMSLVFILCEEFADIVIREDANFKVENTIASMREKYTTQRFKKIIDILETIVLK